MVHDIITAAQDSAGYHDASRLRQARDPEWVIGWAPRTARRLADLGCGTGTLLATALDRLPGLRSVLGLELSPSRLDEASRLLAPYGDRVELRHADLLAPPEPDGRFDVMTMTSVLHWLYPREAEVFRWIADHLDADGTFLLTTYHPPADDNGLGGTDHVVREALALLGVSDAVTAFDRHGVVPIATRNRPVADVELLLAEYFSVRRADERTAVVRVGGAEEYQRFHAATFGTYYSRIVAADRQEAFFAALGETAVRRMREQGFVTTMPVRLWACERRGPRS